MLLSECYKSVCSYINRLCGELGIKRLSLFLKDECKRRFLSLNDSL